MNDFYEDVLQRKRLAQNAKYRKGARGGRTCRLSTDRLTEKQWKGLNGEVMSYDLNKPMSWRYFKAASIHIQSEYLRHLIEKYKVNASSLAQMFWVSPTTVRKHIDVNQIGVSFRVGCCMTAKEREAWERFISKGEQSPLKQAPDRTEWEICATKAAKARMDRFSLSFTGIIDGAAIANSIMSIAGTDSVGHIEIICSLDDTLLNDT